MRRRRRDGKRRSRMSRKSGRRFSEKDMRKIKPRTHPSGCVLGESGWKGSAVDQEIMARYEARVGGAEKRASRAKLFRPADAFRRNRLDALRPHGLRRGVVAPRVGLEQ